MKSQSQGNKISERAFSTTVEDLLTRFGWHWIHIRPARVLRKGIEIYETPVSGYGKGFLDYLALRPPRILVIEVKSEEGKMTPEQQEWFDLWEECQKRITLEPIVRGEPLKGNFPELTIPELYLWRPSDIDPDGGIILEILR